MQKSRKREAFNWTTTSSDELRRLMSEVVSLREMVAQAELKGRLYRREGDSTAD